MIEERLVSLLAHAAVAAAPELGGADPPARIELSRPPDKRFGDFFTNLALVWASQLKRNPREVADAIVRHLPQADFVERAEVAGGGFVNLFVTDSWLYDVLRQAVSQRYGWAEPTGQRVQVEYVSVNPTGPLHVGHARNAVIGDALASVLEASGSNVQREYYLNDYGRQMELFGMSVEARYLQHFGRPAEIPEGGYQGEYVAKMAAEIAARHGDSLLDAPDRRERLLEEGYALALAGIRVTLDRIGIRFDTWFSERDLHATGAVADAVKRLRSEGHAYESEGAIYFRATQFGDEKDRVLIRSNGEPTYFAADCAYLLNKFERGFELLIYVWGADHHGTVKRLKGVARAFGFDPERVEFLLMQLVTLSRGGEPVRLSKRAGDIVTLDELLDEAGPDAARYTLLTRSHDSQMEFDIELATRQANENPVFYVQYAHARIASILRHAEELGVALRPVDEARLDLLTHETELELLRKVAELPNEIRQAADFRAPHRLTHYVEDFAAQFHRFYGECRVVSDDDELTQARLWLCRAAKEVVAGVLGLLGVSAPEAMERREEG